MDKLVNALDKIFTELKCNRVKDWTRLGGRANVGVEVPATAYGSFGDRVWKDNQLGLVDGTAPKTLRNSDKAVVDKHAVNASRARFNVLLGPVAEDTDVHVTSVFGAVLKNALGGPSIVDAGLAAGVITEKARDADVAAGS